MLFKKIDPDSENSVTSALNFFATPPTSTFISSSCYREYLSLNPLNSKPYNFKIFPITSFIDLSKVYIYSEFKIVEVKDDGTVADLAADAKVSCIQMPGQTFIKNLTVTGKYRYNYSNASG